MLIFYIGLFGLKYIGHGGDYGCANRVDHGCGYGGDYAGVHADYAGDHADYAGDQADYADDYADYAGDLFIMEFMLFHDKYFIVYVNILYWFI